MNCTKEELLEKIKEAYAKTGLKVCFGDYFTEDNLCACPVGAVHCAATESRTYWFMSSVAKNTFAKLFNVNQEWVNNFIHGIDGTGNYGGRNLEESYKYGQYIRKQLGAN